MSSCEHADDQGAKMSFTRAIRWTLYRHAEQIGWSYVCRKAMSTTETGRANPFASML